MIIDKLTPLKDIVIWQPRWHDKRVLIACHKVGEHNRITFTKAPTYPDVYYLSGKTIKKYKKESNGTIDCYSVPLSELEPLEINQKDWRILA